MKKKEIENNYWKEMAKRPYPYNREETIIAQAISPWGGMKVQERAQMILDLSEGRSVVNVMK